MPSNYETWRARQKEEQKIKIPSTIAAIRGLFFSTKEKVTEINQTVLDTENILWEKSLRNKESITSLHEKITSASNASQTFKKREPQPSRTKNFFQSFLSCFGCFARKKDEATEPLLRGYSRI